jgi:hypothetical protein
MQRTARIFAFINAMIHLRGEKARLIFCWGRDPMRVKRHPQTIFANVQPTPPHPPSGPLPMLLTFNRECQLKCLKKIITLVHSNFNTQHLLELYHLSLYWLCSFLFQGLGPVCKKYSVPSMKVACCIFKGHFRWKVYGPRSNEMEQSYWLRAIKLDPPTAFRWVSKTKKWQIKAKPTMAPFWRENQWV